MNLVRSLFDKGPRHVAAVASDEVFPLHFIDRSASLRYPVQVSTWCFNDVLDGDKLHQSLDHLLHLGDWKKLGGRFRLGKDGKLEIHVPEQFTSDRPSIHYSHESLPMRAAEHPLAGRIPKASSRASFHPATEEFLLALTARPGMPHNMEDYLSSDEPLLSLRVIVFLDATIVSLAWPHAVMDAVGMATVIQAWSLVLAGRENEILPIDGVRDDLLYQASLKPAAEKFALEPYMLTGFRFYLLILRLICDILFGGRRENRIIYLPPKSVQNLHSQAMCEINLHRKEPLKITCSDAILALFSRSLVLAQKRPLLVVVPMDLRSRLNDIFLPNMSYPQNAIQGGHFTVNADETSINSIGHLALAFRQNIVQQGGRQQLLAMLRCNREISDSGGDPATLYGPSNAIIMSATNLNKANFLSITDFSPAVVGERCREEATGSPGTPSFFNTSHSKMAWRRPNILMNLGIDQDGGHWISGSFNIRTWKHVEESLKDL
ncbi:unnamed protein product [Clonostachys chloroleuca]|uniref:Uncharacterized protein n=1 Tax=Clonostachys chloroleuca TaxID=1926264 RepID=A0AA35MI01_9HYPO|nr:unnamed protein product [Clonostachys chloroleuca]